MYFNTAAKMELDLDTISLAHCLVSKHTDNAATEYDEECMIYTHKVSERYQRTGNKIVSDVMHTETKLTLDQCASLCYEVSDGDETGCKSFNYCPKSRKESSCSSTHFSVKSPDTKTTDGSHCSNYELKESNGKKRKESSSTKVIKGTSGSGAFGIIMLFLFVGIGLGFIAPFAYSKVKQIHEASKASGGFTWKRHQDEQPLENVD
uniref:Apple domain-containing protein n=2 Tax=Tetranychus urticae TaxID=32264 RepID=T1L681_TETUR